MADCAQECKDCEGLGEWACYGKAYFCKTCDGTGEIERTGPYRLADGTWSDEVDRSVPISHLGYGDNNPARLAVCQFSGKWAVLRGQITIGSDGVGWHETPAEAIAYADRMARTNQGENK